MPQSEAFRQEFASVWRTPIVKRIRKLVLVIFCALWVLYQNFWEGSFVPMVYVHELGHGVTALLLLGEAKGLTVFESGPYAGVIRTWSPLPGSAVLIKAGGAMAETLVSAVLGALPWAICRGIGIGSLINVGINLFIPDGQYRSDLKEQGREASWVIAALNFLALTVVMIRRIRSNWFLKMADGVLHGAARRIPDRVQAVRKDLGSRGFYRKKIYTRGDCGQRARFATEIKQRTAGRPETPGNLPRPVSRTGLPATPQAAADQFREALRRQRELADRN